MTSPSISVSFGFHNSLVVLHLASTSPQFALYVVHVSPNAGPPFYSVFSGGGVIASSLLSKNVQGNDKHVGYKVLKNGK